MDLFIVNRHLDAEIPEIHEETEKLKATTDRIAKNRKKALRKHAAKDKLRDLKTHFMNKRHYANQNARIFAALNEDQEPEVPAVDQHEDVTEADDTETSKKPKGKKRKLKNEDNIEGFTVLGTDDYKQKAPVKRVLPEWLANPRIISVDLQNLQTKVSTIKALDKQLRNKLKEENVKYFFPVQAEVIPYFLKTIQLRDCMSPNDICVSAPTGSGKTLTYVLPIIQALRGSFVKQIRALIILPTQDLATQVYKTFNKYAEGSNLDVLLVTGNASFAQEQTQLVVKNVAFGYISKVDILIGTAGRLVDHMKHTPGFTLEHMRFLVIDEADRVLENVQNDWLYHLERHIYKDEPKDLNVLNVSNYRSRRAPQKLLFSATLSQDPEKLHKLGLFQPKLFTSVIEGEDPAENMGDNFTGKYTTPKELTEKYIVSTLELKPLVLYKFIKDENLTKTLVFANSLEHVHRLKVLLQCLFNDERKVEEIGSQLDRQVRNKLISKFASGEIDILICTDSLSRGIDLAGVKCVISYNAPKFIKTYIHRAGRTARAGEEGLAVTMVLPPQLASFNAMLKQADKGDLMEIKIEEESLEQFGEQYTGALAALKTTIHAEDVKKTKKFYSAKRQYVKTNNEKTIP